MPGKPEIFYPSRDADLPTGTDIGADRDLPLELRWTFLSDASESVYQTTQAGQPFYFNRRVEPGFGRPTETANRGGSRGVSWIATNPTTNQTYVLYNEPIGLGTRITDARYKIASFNASSGAVTNVKTFSNALVPGVFLGGNDRRPLISVRPYMTADSDGLTLWGSSNFQRRSRNPYYVKVSYSELADSRIPSRSNLDTLTQPFTQDLPRIIDGVTGHGEDVWCISFTNELDDPTVHRMVKTTSGANPYEEDMASRVSFQLGVGVNAVNRSGGIAQSSSNGGILGFAVDENLIYLIVRDEAKSTDEIAAYMRSTGVRCPEETIDLGVRINNNTDPGYAGLARTTTGNTIATGQDRLYEFKRTGAGFNKWQARRRVGSGPQMYYLSSGSWIQQRETAASTQHDVIGGDAPLTFLRNRPSFPSPSEYSFAFPSNWEQGSIRQQFQVRNRDAAGSWSDWSDAIHILPDSAITPQLTVPATDGGDLLATYTPTWTLNKDQAYYRITTQGDNTYQNTGLVTSAARSHTWTDTGDDKTLDEFGEIPAEAELVTITLEVWSAKFLKATTTRTGVVRYPTPSTASRIRGAVRLELDETAFRVPFGIEEPTPGVAPATVKVEIWRRVDGIERTEVLLFVKENPLTGLSANSDFIDYTPPANRDVTYRVLTFGNRGQYDTSALWQ